MQTRTQKSKSTKMPGRPEGNAGIGEEEEIELSTDQKLNKLLESLKEVTAIRLDIKQINTTVKAVSSDQMELKVDTKEIPGLKLQLKNLQASVDNMKVEHIQTQESLKDTNRRIKDLEEENVDLRNDLDNLKSKIRRENNIEEKELEELVALHIQRQNDKLSLLIEGVPESYHEDTKQIVKQIAFDAKVNLQDKDINEVFRMGKFNQKDKRPRSIKVTFASRTTRNTVYQNRMDIKINPACKDIWINECLDEHQKQKRSEIRAVTDLATSLGREARAVGETAIISGIRYDHGSLSTLPGELSLEKAFTRELEDRLYFNSEHSKLSSFYPIEIEYKEHKYKNLEQGLQHTKALIEEENDIANIIMKDPKPRRCKALGKKVPSTEKWNNVRDEVMTEMIKLKAQDPKIKAFLLSTGQKQLIEATGDNYWACGASFRSKKVQQNQTTGKNNLGKAWIKLREDLRSKDQQAQKDPTPTENDGEKDKIQNDMPPLEGDGLH